MDEVAELSHGPAEVGATTVVVAESSGGVVGFGACGDQRDDTMRERGFPGEIGALYILRSHQRAGVGRSLVSVMARALTVRRLDSASLWVLRENIGARRFYESLGGFVGGEKTTQRGDAVLTEVAYCWSDLSRLL